MKPTIVLVPGAWHPASCYDILLPYLQNAGYETLALTLPSVSADPPVPSIDPDVEHIRNNVEPLLQQGKDVVAVFHSYGGVPGSSAMKGFSKPDRKAQGQPGGVTALVYLCSWMIAEGTTMVENGGGRGGKRGPETMKVENGRITHLDPIPAMYHDVAPELAEQLAATLRPHSMGPLGSPCQYGAHKHIPTTYLLAENDEMIPYERQKALVENAGAPITTFTCNASHSPFVSQPEFTAKVIRRAAGENIQV